jgi:hypothetical protein
MTPRHEIQEYLAYDDTPYLRPPSRWEMLRDAVVLQGKLFIDGIRDLVLGPIAVAAAVLDIFGVGDRAGRHFYDVVRFGRATEHWINLFGAADHVLPTSSLESPQGLDAVVKRLERVVVQEYERGGMTANAKSAVDRAIDRIQTRQQGEAPGEPGEPDER